jgi:hypothetical protein
LKLWNKGTKFLQHRNYPRHIVSKITQKAVQNLPTKYPPDVSPMVVEVGLRLGVVPELTGKSETGASVVKVAVGVSVGAREVGDRAGVKEGLPVLIPSSNDGAPIVVSVSVGAAVGSIVRVIGD